MCRGQTGRRWNCGKMNESIECRSNNELIACAGISWDCRTVRTVRSVWIEHRLEYSNTGPTLYNVLRSTVYCAVRMRTLTLHEPLQIAHTNEYHWDSCYFLTIFCTRSKPTPPASVGAAAHEAIQMEIPTTADTAPVRKRKMVPSEADHDEASNQPRSTEPASGAPAPSSPSPTASGPAFAAAAVLLH